MKEREMWTDGYEREREMWTDMRERERKRERCK